MMSAPARPIVVRVLVTWKIWPVAPPWITAREKRLSLGSSTMPILWRSRPVIVLLPTSAGPPACSTAVRLVERSTERAGSVGGAAGGGGGAAAGRGPGGRVMAPSAGVSISMVPPHLPHFVFALGRSPSFDSSNLYLA